MKRRTALQLIAGSLAETMLAACARRTEARRTEERTAMDTSLANASKDTMPAVFIAHGSPLLLDDSQWVKELAAWSKAMPKPKAILMISAHWIDDPVTLGATRTIPLVYDFYGFPQKYYNVTYASPGAPELAKRVRQLLEAHGPVKSDESRGLDHGAYVPLVAMHPAADIPVLQVSIPTMEPKALLAMGRALAPLRQEGVLIAGSGFLTHNMRALDWSEGARTPAWASEFDAWANDAFSRRDVDALATYRERAPGVRMALPTHEHFVPALVAAGASLDRNEAVTMPISGFTYGSFTKRSLQFG